MLRIYARERDPALATGGEAACGFGRCVACHRSGGRGWSSGAVIAEMGFTRIIARLTELTTRGLEAGARILFGVAARAAGRRRLST